VSACLKVCAINLIKIANDLRLLASGPMAGLYEIQLPAVQPGSSIMPAKVNPVIAEVTNQVGFHILGNDLAVTMAAQAGQLELNVFQPVLLYNMLQSIEILGNVARTLKDRCIVGIKANKERCAKMVEENVGVVTALVPYIGYQHSCDIAKEARATGKSVRALVVEKGFMTEKELNHVFAPSRVTRPGKPDAELNRHRVAVSDSETAVTKA
jgi:aspartate ammonia-lyase